VFPADLAVRDDVLPLSPESWFVWDCAGVWDDFERFQAAVLRASAIAFASNSAARSQLDDCLETLRRMNSESFCVAVEDFEQPTTARDHVLLVNVCSRHKEESSASGPSS
jgi:hypothetical protein